MKKMKDYLRKVTAGLLLVAMSSGSVGVNTVSGATDDDNDPSTTTDIIPERLLLTSILPMVNSVHRILL